MEPWQILDLLVRGMAVGAQLGLAIALARSAEDLGLRIVTLLLFISSISLTLTGVPQILRMMGSAQILLWLIQIGGAGYFWLFAVILFEDRRVTWTSTSPSVALTMIGLFGQYGPRALAPATWGIHNVIGLLLALNALVVIVRSGQNDLVEARRRLRVPLLLMIAVFSIVVSAVQIGQGLGINSRWYQFANAAIQALLGIGGVAVLLEARSTLFGVAAGRPDPVAPAPIDDGGLWLERLRQVMDVGSFRGRFRR